MAKLQIKEREPIKTLSYSDVQFKFINNYYDVNLGGSCLYNNEICEFKNKIPNYDEEKDEWEEMIVKIYKLNWIEKLKWVWKQWLFEKCVGYHWSYKNGKKGKNFYYRKPKWFYVWIFNIYYGR